MEVLILLILIVLLFVVLSAKNNLADRLSSLERTIEELKDRIAKTTVEPPISPRQEGRHEEQEKQVLTQRPKPVEPVKQPELARPERPVVIEPVIPPVISRTPVVQETPKDPENVLSSVGNRRGGFFEKNADLEKFIGENLANKIGIAILVLGIGYFVKLAIDREWITENGRVFIGILCGGVLLAIAHRLRKSFAAFSSVLVGGGIAVLYFTIAIAFHEYHIFTSATAFILMVLITSFSVILSLGYNRVELAVLAILGGFGSPFMVSTGEGNYIVLFTYILILNGGMLVLAYHKKWKIVNIICYVFTILIFGTWLTTKFDAQNTSMIRNSLIFATLFYFIFFAKNIINNIRQRVAFTATEFVMLLSNTFLYFSAGLMILNNETGNDFKGLFTSALGIFNFIFAYTLYKKMNVDRNLVFMLIGLVLTFISLTAPIQLEGNYITLFWSAEAVLLLWLGQKSGIQLIKIASIIVVALMVISLMIDWKQIYFDVSTPLTIVLNKGYITSLVSIASLFLTARLLKKEQNLPLVNVVNYSIAITFGTLLIVYISNLLELRHQLMSYVDSFSEQEIIIGSYNIFFLMALLMVERSIKISDDIKNVSPLLGIIAMMAYLLYYHQIIIDSRNEFIEGTATPSGFIFHYLLIGLLITAVALSLRKLNVFTSFAESTANAHWWIYTFFFVFLASAELDHTVVLLASSETLTVEYLLAQNHKIGYPILWGVTSFILIAIGLRRKIKSLRIISLALLSITLLKLFIVDLRGISDAGKIAAFTSLGILLLIVSFMYQRIKKLLMADSTETETEKTA